MRPNKDAFVPTVHSFVIVILFRLQFQFALTFPKRNLRPVFFSRTHKTPDTVTIYRKPAGRVDRNTIDIFHRKNQFQKKIAETIKYAAAEVDFYATNWIEMAGDDLSVWESEREMFSILKTGNLRKYNFIYLYITHIIHFI